MRHVLITLCFFGSIFDASIARCAEPPAINGYMPALAAGRKWKVSVERQSEPPELPDSELVTVNEKLKNIETDGKNMEVLHITLQCDGDGHSNKASQKWLRGLPWWLEAKYERDGKEWCSAKLVMD